MHDNNSVSVVICAHTEERWHDLLKAVESIQNQAIRPDETIVVIDHNPRLLERVKKQFPYVETIENREPKGASGSKNSGALAARSSIIAFLDDDAIAEPDWLSHLKGEFYDSSIVGVGGFTQPIWTGERPVWFPEEFYWVLGCSHKGLPEETTAVRNLIACNMAVRKSVFDKIGGFRNGLGPRGGRALGCEDTEFCIRVRQTWPKSIWLYQPEAKVWHNVPRARAGWRYFVRRCFGEGLSKALITRFIGMEEGLSSEREHVLKNLPEGILKGFKDAFFNGDSTGLARASAIIVGLLITIAGFLFAQISTVSFLFMASIQKFKQHYKYLVR